MELAWLYKTAWNVLANKRRKFVEIPIEELDIEGDDIADVIIEDENLKNAWLRLSIRDREVLRLTAWDGLSPDQLALVLNISVSGAGAALSRARRKFEEEMVK
jgi:RNA polymerase sigma-70 factor (ECF subfamily)